MVAAGLAPGVCVEQLWVKAFVTLSNLVARNRHTP
jgi:hypothetical protein